MEIGEGDRQRMMGFKRECGGLFCVRVRVLGKANYRPFM